MAIELKYRNPIETEHCCNLINRNSVRSDIQTDKLYLCVRQLRYFGTLYRPCYNDAQWGENKVNLLLRQSVSDETL